MTLIPHESALMIRELVKLHLVRLGLMSGNQGVLLMSLCGSNRTSSGSLLVMRTLTWISLLLLPFFISLNVVKGKDDLDGSCDTA